MKKLYKKKFVPTDIFFVAVNLLPLWGVWFQGWDAVQIFFVYCLESVIIGFYNVIMMLLTTSVKKKDVWSNGGTSTMVSGYGFIIFFIIHYGFFLAIQMSIFFSFSGNGTDGFTADKFFDAVFQFRFTADSPPAVWLLFIFIATHGLILVKDFIITGNYKKASLGALLFAPYARVFVQQFCVILGGFLLQFGAGKIFILIFVIVKIFFESVLDYQKIITESIEEEASKNLLQ